MTGAPAVAIIPARFGSTRFAGKPLADATGKPLIQHVVERAREARTITRVIVATDDQRIFAAVEGFGGEVVMTCADHPNGTSRIAEVAAGLPESEVGIVVNVQGDEPEIEPRVIDELVEGLVADEGAPMATLASPFMAGEDAGSPHIVKVVTAGREGRLRALYFSRSLIPFDRDGGGEAALKHPGVYAYRRAFLLKYPELAPTPLEGTEKLEQLRALEHGYPIAIVRTRVTHHGIDTPEQYDAFVRRYRSEGGGG